MNIWEWNTSLGSDRRQRLACRTVLHQHYFFRYLLCTHTWYWIFFVFFITILYAEIKLQGVVYNNVPSSYWKSVITVGTTFKYFVWAGCGVYMYSVLCRVHAGHGRARCCVGGASNPGDPGSDRGYSFCNSIASILCFICYCLCTHTHTRHCIVW